LGEGGGISTEILCFSIGWGETDNFVLWLIVPGIDDGDCGAIGGTKIGRGNRSTMRKSALAPICPPQIPHDQTRAAAVGSQRRSLVAEDKKQ
jgi:hypothetical protein